MCRGAPSSLDVLVEKHAKKQRERVRVEEAIGVGVAGDGESARHGGHDRTGPIDGS